MHTFNRALSITLGTAFTLSALGVSTHGAPITVETKAGRSMMIPAVVNAVSSPLAGIKLLDQIYQRCSQLAFDKKQTLIASYGGQKPATSPSQLDYMLAIKPPADKGRKAVARKPAAKAEEAPKIAMAEPEVTDKFKAADDMASDGVTQQSVAERRREPNQNSAMWYRSTSQYQMTDDRPVAKDFRAQTAGAIAGKNKETKQRQSLDAEKPASTTAAAGGSARFSYQANNGKNDTAEQHRGFNALSRSVNNLASATGAMQSQMQSMDALSNLNVPTRAVPASTLKAHALAKKSSAPTLMAQRDSAPTAIPSGEGVSEYQPAGLAGNAQNLAGNNGTAPLLQGSPPPPPALSTPGVSATPNQNEFGTVTIENPGKYKYLHEYQQQAPQQRLAQVVPTVISGIPLVKLGANAEDAVKALRNTHGSITQQKVVDTDTKQVWFVWTVKKPNSTETELQLFIKHGTVAAVRVFDRSLIPFDLGVTLGDELQTVKSRFGEPAFIMSEADNRVGGTGGRNYVYPMSQVSFQISRVHNQFQPQVVSLMIFNATP
ncbi:MAG TPA: hypothetical protein V6C81_26160 [Planktothrix sp.]|jgi:hypothetical protein